jgi:hypothetical protein
VPEPIPGLLTSFGWKFVGENTHVAGCVQGDSGAGAFAFVEGSWLFLGPVGGSEDSELVRWDRESNAAIGGLLNKDNAWIDAQNAQWLPPPPVPHDPRAQPAGYPFITPGLDPTLLPQVDEECGLARWMSASQIKQMVEMARPGENIGFVWVSAEAPPVVDDPAFKNFIWIDLSTQWPYAQREFNHATGSWDIVVPRPGSYTGDIFKDDSISLGKLVPPGAGNALKVLTANSNGTEYVWMFGKDTIQEKSLSLSKLLIPDSAAVGMYVTVVAKNTLGFTTLTSDKIVGLIPDNSLTLAKLSTAPGLVKQLLGIDETDPKKWKFYDPATASGGNDPRIPVTPTAANTEEDGWVLAIEPNEATYRPKSIITLLQGTGYSLGRRWTYKGVKSVEGQPLPEGKPNHDHLFAGGDANSAVHYWKHGLEEMPKKWQVYARLVYRIVYEGDDVPAEKDIWRFREDQFFDINIIQAGTIERDGTYIPFGVPAYIHTRYKSNTIKTSRYHE